MINYRNLNYLCPRNKQTTLQIKLLQNNKNFGGSKDLMKNLPILVRLQLMEQTIILATLVLHLIPPKKNPKNQLNKFNHKIIRIKMKNLILFLNLARILGMYNHNRKIIIILVAVNNHLKLSLYSPHNNIQKQKFIIKQINHIIT